MNTAEILRAAAARVREGWTQDGYADGFGGVCAIGAMAVVTGLSEERIVNGDYRGEVCFIEETVGAYVSGALRLTTDRCCRSGLPRWNDAEGQTAENVAAGLEYAALLWEQEQATPVNAGATALAVGATESAHD